MAAVITATGALLDTRSFRTTREDYRQLLAWACAFGRLQRAGVECTGSYGAALTRYLHTEGITVTEVNQPDKATRRRRGKTDAIDAAAAAQTVVSGRATATAKTSDEPTLSAPFGDIFLTSTLAHLTALGSTRPVLVLHADRSPADHALRAETRELARQLPHARADFWYERPGPEEPTAHEGLMDLNGVDIPDGATVFLCGPLPFMREVRAQLLRAGVPAQRIRYEVFGPDLRLPDTAA